MAITAVYYKPHIWSPGFNPVIWSFISDQSTQTDFSYVIEMYINGATGPSYTLKQRPSPSGGCMVDVSAILQGNINLADYSAEAGWPSDFRNSDTITPNVYLKVGEEYVSNGVLTTFNGLGATGEPAYEIYAREANKPVRILPAALTYEDSVEHMSLTSNYGYFAPYIMDGDGKFLKRLGNTQDIATDQHHTLSFLNWNDFPESGSWQSPVQGVLTTFYSATGPISSAFYQNIVSNGGGPMTSGAYTTATETRATNMITFACGTKDLGVPSTATYYTVQAYYKGTATTATTPQTIASELVTFNVKDYCENLYPVVRLSWLNDLGARDYYNFDMFYEKKTSSPGDTWYQNPIDWTAQTPYALSTDADKTRNWLRGGEKSFGKTVQTSFQIQTDFLPQETVDALAQIPESSSVWAYIGDATNPVTIQITNVEDTYANVKQRKLVQATMDCVITKVQPKQNM